MYEYVNIAIGMNVTFCIIGWGILIAQHEMCTNLSRPSTLPKKKRKGALGARLWLARQLGYGLVSM